MSDAPGWVGIGMSALVFGVGLLDKRRQDRRSDEQERKQDRRFEEQEQRQEVRDARQAITNIVSYWTSRQLGTEWVVNDMNREALLASVKRWREVLAADRARLVTHGHQGTSRAHALASEAVDAAKAFLQTVTPLVDRHPGVPGNVWNESDRRALEAAIKPFQVRTNEAVRKLVRALQQTVLDADMVPLVIAPAGGKLDAGGDPITVQRTFATARSIEFDALVLAGAPDPARTPLPPVTPRPVIPRRRTGPRPTPGSC